MDFYVLKRWIYLAIAVSVSVASCWGSVRVIQAKDAHGHDREPHSVKSTDDLGPDDSKRPRSSIPGHHSRNAKRASVRWISRRSG